MEDNVEARLYEVMQTTTKMSGQLEGVSTLIARMDKRLDKLDDIAKEAAVQSTRLTQLEEDQEQMKSEIEVLQRDSVEGDAKLARRIEVLEKADGTNALASWKSIKKTIISTLIGVMIPTLLGSISVIISLFKK